jgi:hypothetical protein
LLLYTKNTHNKDNLVTSWKNPYWILISSIYKFFLEEEKNDAVFPIWWRIKPIIQETWRHYMFYKKKQLWIFILKLKIQIWRHLISYLSSIIIFKWPQSVSEHMEFIQQLCFWYIYATPGRQQRTQCKMMASL